MNFEERLLMELKAEMARRATREPARRPRWIMTRTRIGAVAVMAAAAVAVPLMPGGRNGCVRGGEEP